VRLEPGAEVDGVAEYAVDTVTAAADDPGQDGPRVETDPKARPVGMGGADGFGALLKLERGTGRLKSVV
jgi:hypothetical protein